MSDIKDGGPAFPTKNYQSVVPVATGYSEGISIRDYFAAKAMPMVATEIYAMGQQVHGTTVPALTAKMAYEYADAMLAAREAK